MKKSYLLVQGDVFLIRKEIPKDAKKLNHNIIAEGEATGHAHRIEQPSTLYEKDGVLYLRTTKESKVTHEEHKPVTVPPGDWQIGIVKEYDPFEQESRNVRD